MRVLTRVGVVLGMLLVVGPVRGAEAVGDVRVSAVMGEGERVRVTFRNVGEGATVLNLGVALGNGQSFRPTHLVLVVTGADGGVREMRYKGGFAGGVVEDYLVPLPAGGSSEVVVGLGDFQAHEKGVLVARPVEAGETVQVRRAPVAATHGQAKLTKVWGTEVTSEGVVVK
jgi:hypothetical protein